MDNQKLASKRPIKAVAKDCQSRHNRQICQKNHEVSKDNFTRLGKALDTISELGKALNLPSELKLGKAVGAKPRAEFSFSLQFLFCQVCSANLLSHRIISLLSVLKELAVDHQTCFE